MTRLDRLRQELAGTVYGRGDTIRVIVAVHPLRAEKVELRLMVGLSLGEMVEQACAELNLPSLAKSIVCYIDGHPVERANWDRVRPKSGTVVVMRAVAEAPVAAAFGAIFSAVSAATASIGAFFGGLGIIGKVIGLGLAIGAQYLLNALFPVRPPQLSQETNERGKQAYSISGSRNTLAPYEPVPVILGQHRVTPYYGAQDFTEAVNDELYWRGLFVWGYGPLEVTDLKIGETPITSFQDVQIEGVTGWPGEQNTVLPIYSRQAFEEQLSIELEHNIFWVGRTTADNITEISVDFVWPSGLYSMTKTDGRKHVYTVNIGVRYRLSGTLNWVELPQLSVGANTVDPVRRTVRWAVPPGRYDVEARRITWDDNALETADWTMVSPVVFSAIRGFRQSSPITFPKPLARSAIRIRASSQLNGALEQLNGMVTSIVGFAFDGSVWRPSRPSRNCADLFRHVLQGPANARPVPNEKIDIAALEGWWRYCSVQGFTFDQIRTSATSVQDVLADIASAGRASPVFKDGRYSVVWDELDTPVVQVLTPRNSWGFEAQRDYIDAPHGWRVRFINREKGYIDDERIVYDDGYSASNATLFEQLEFPGVTSPATIWRHGRFHIAQLRLRPEQVTLSVDWENLVCTRGDRVRVQHDVMLIGQQSGRIVSVSGSTVTLDEPVIVEQGKTYSLRYRLADGTILMKSVPVGPVGTEEVRTVTLSGGGALPAEGDLFAFGETNRETAIYRVLGIEPGDNMSARLILVDDAPEISQADRGTIPPFRSNISAPPDPFKLPPYSLQVTQDAYDDGGEFRARMRLDWQSPPAGRIARFDVEMRRDTITGPRFVAVGSTPASQTNFTLDRLEAGIYAFRVRAIFTDGTFSGWATSPAVRTDALLSPPPNVTGFQISVLGDLSTLTWDQALAPGLSHYEIRFVPEGAAVEWNSATPLLPRIASTSAQVATQIGSYLIKAVLLSGLRSRDATVIKTNVASLAGVNVVATLIEGPNFTGTRQGVDITPGQIRLASKNTIDKWERLSNVAVIGEGGGASRGVQVEGFYYFANSLDLGATYTSRLTASIDAYGEDLLNVISQWGSLSDIEFLDNSEPDDWNVQLEVRTTTDAPSSGNWSDWQPFVVGDMTARAFEFRLKLNGKLVSEVSAEYSTITPVVTGVSVTIDMPDRIEAGEDIAIPAAGLRINFNPPFRGLAGISTADQNMLTGDYKVISAKDETGFFIRYFSANGTAVARTMDYVAKGYGR